MCFCHIYTDNAFSDFAELKRKGLIDYKETSKTIKNVTLTERGREISEKISAIYGATAYKKDMRNKIRVPVNGGYLVAGRNSDPDYDGIYIVFETDEGDLIDVVLTECKAENEQKKIDVYAYEDVYTEDWTRKYTLDTEEIKKVLDGE